MLNVLPQGYEWRYIKFAGVGGRWVRTRKMGLARRARVELQAYQRDTKRRLAEAAAKAKAKASPFAPETMS